MSGGRTIHAELAAALLAKVAGCYACSLFLLAHNVMKPSKSRVRGGTRSSGPPDIKVPRYIRRAFLLTVLDGRSVSTDDHAATAEPSTHKSGSLAFQDGVDEG